MLEAIKSTDWAWGSHVKHILGITASSTSGSFTEMDMSCVAGFGFEGTFYFNLIWPLGVAAMVLLAQ